MPNTWNRKHADFFRKKIRFIIRDAAGCVFGCKKKLNIGIHRKVRSPAFRRTVPGVGTANSGYFRSAEIMNTPEFNSNSERKNIIIITE
ncbi:MAG: hypothetical protein BWK80_62140 [Desulfobacteraceae bacterium IS3]|nr:MAG: hypothetical protein BWK80_62140 [Desulfobacteraceae bacterium IS3]